MITKYWRRQLIGQAKWIMVSNNTNCLMEGSKYHKSQMALKTTSISIKMAMYKSRKTDMELRNKILLTKNRKM
jgi:hypothetical protein